MKLSDWSEENNGVSNYFDCTETPWWGLDVASTPTASSDEDETNEIQNGYNHLHPVFTGPLLQAEVEAEAEA